MKKNYAENKNRRLIKNEYDFIIKKYCYLSIKFAFYRLLLV